jgi:iron complex transport system substrate-binding protein
LVGESFAGILSKLGENARYYIIAEERRMKKAALIMLMMILVSSLMAIMPAVASEYVLKIFGNANMDDTINEMDIAYVEGIISGKNKSTDLADANHDGKIDENDITKIESILSEEKTNLTLIDQANRVVTVPRPAARIALTGMLNELKTLVSRQLFNVG